MSRSDYCDDDCGDRWARIRWRGAVASAIRGRRGQALLRELIAALDAMPEQRLTAEAFTDDTGAVCALGAVGRARGLDMSDVDPYDHEAVAKLFGVPKALAREVMYENDEVGFWDQTSCESDIEERRWREMRAWAVRHLVDGGMSRHEHGD